MALNSGFVLSAMAVAAALALLPYMARDQPLGTAQQSQKRGPSSPGL